MCQVLGVSRSGYYTWSEQDQPTETQTRRQRLTARIVALFDEFNQVYGCRRIHRELVKEGEEVCVRTVSAIMREQGLVAVQSHAFKVTTQPDGEDHQIPDLIEQDFTSQTPGEKLVGDITYLRTGQGWLYLATVIDLATRMVVGWSMATRMRASLVVDALKMASQHGYVADQAIFHSDRGSQYTSGRVWCLLPSYWCAPIHGPCGHVLRQCGGRVVLCYLEKRDVPPLPIPHHRTGQIRRSPIHRAVLQP